MKTKEEILKNHAEQKYIFGDGMTHKQSLILLNSIYMAMDEYASQLQQEWIPVEVRLPEIEYDYLVTNGRAQMVAAFRTSTKTWDFWDNSSFWDNDEVTHWKPLPPLPQPYNPKQS